jgi:5-methylcytosine-specific restriction enzyme A
MSETHPHWHKWYKRACWLKAAAHQLRIEPFCRICKARGEATVATVVDHVVPHKGNWNSFRLGPLQSLCKPCHDGAKRFEDMHGFDNRIGVDGMPIDSRHPFNRA